MNPKSGSEKHGVEFRSWLRPDEFNRDEAIV